MSGYISVPRQAGGHLKNGVVDILVQWSCGHIGGGIAYERIVALAARSTAPPTEPPEATVAGVVDEYLTAKDAEIARLTAALDILLSWADSQPVKHPQQARWRSDARAALKGDT